MFLKFIQYIQNCDYDFLYLNNKSIIIFSNFSIQEINTLILFFYYEWGKLTFNFYFVITFLDLDNLDYIISFNNYFLLLFF